MNRERGFLYGVVALQAALVDPAHLSEFLRASEEWNEDRDGPLAEMLVRKGWIRPSDRAHLEYLVERKLQQHSGDAKAGLASVTVEIERSRGALRDDKIERTLGTCPGSQRSLPMPEVAAVSPARDRYSLNSLHATGGIGRVWLARDAQMGREVALKELRPEQANDAVLRARFLREAQVTGQLEHPGIVPVYEMAFRPDTGQPFYTMRFVKGRTLSDAAKSFHQTRAEGKADSLDFLSLLNAFVVVCKTVAYAHSRGVIHRDLKGQNVVVGDFGEVVVLDWGLAKLVRPDADPCCGPVVTSERGLAKGVDRIDEKGQTPPPVSAVSDATTKVDLTMHGDMLGTPAYMAPEQAAGHLDLIDRRTDVYGLGAILYQLLTGQPPFTGANVKELLGKVESEQPLPPQQFWAEIPPSLQAACLRALAKDPAARFASAGELAHEVEQWQEVQRKKAEDALRVSQALYHSLVESIPLCVWRKDRDGRFTFANNSFSEAFGIKPEDMIGRNDEDFFPPELVQKIRCDDSHVLNTGETVRSTEERPTDARGPRFVEVIKIPVRDANGGIIGTQGIFWDMTIWKRTQEALQESEALYHSLVDCVSINVWRKDLEGRFTFVSKGFCDPMGLTPKDFLGKTDYDFFPREMADKYRRDDAQVHETGQVLRTPEVAVVGNGETRFAEVIKIPVRDAHGKIVGTQGIFWDMTDWRRTQEALQESEALYQSLMECSSLNVWRKDLAGRFTFANKGFCESMALTREELIGKTDSEVDLFAGLADKYRREDLQVIETGRQLRILEDRCLPTGKKVVLEVIKIPIRDAHGTVVGTQGVFWDVAAWKAAQEEAQSVKEPPQ